MKSWKTVFRDKGNSREWGISQSMSGIVVGEITPHRPPTDLRGASGEGDISTPSIPLAILPEQAGSTFSELWSFQEQRVGGGGISQLPWRRAPARS